MGRGEGEKKLWGAMNRFIVLTVVMVSWMYMCVQTHQIVHFLVCSSLYITYTSIKKRLERERKGRKKQISHARDVRVASVESEA
jgi:hypothetical protein